MATTNTGVPPRFRKGVTIGVTGDPKAQSGAGAPTHTATRGTIYLRNDGGVDTSFYVNTDGATNWVALLSSAAGGSQADLIFDAATTLTIAGGIITATQGYHLIDTEAAAASDDLDTINGITEGEIVWMRTVASARNVVLKHGTGNLLLPGGKDWTLDLLTDGCLFVGLASSKVACLPSTTGRNAELTASFVTLAAITNGNGASLVGVEDASAYYAQATVEACLQELMDLERGNSLSSANGSAISVARGGVARITTAGAETRTLAIPTYIGQELTLYFQTDGGDAVITVASAINVAGNTVITFDTVNESITLRGVNNGVALAWRVLANDGGVLS